MDRTIVISSALSLLAFGALLWQAATVRRVLGFSQPRALALCVGLGSVSAWVAIAIFVKAYLAVIERSQGSLGLPLTLVIAEVLLVTLAVAIHAVAFGALTRQPVIQAARSLALGTAGATTLFVLALAEQIAR